ncbi:MAG: RlmE family RNA methyltransferase [Deltaproteobacteria bacterium]
MKEIQDYYFKKAKKEGYPARSVYKLEEIQKKFSLLRRGDKILDLGCQPGSWSMYAAKIAGPTGLVVGIDLSSGKKNQVSGGAPIRTFVADIMEEQTVELIRRQSGTFDVVMSDIAPRTSGNKWADQQLSIRLSRRVLQLADIFLREGGNFYCKVFEGEDFREFFGDLRNRYKTAKIFKPKSSRKESREVFVVGLSRLAESS